LTLGPPCYTNLCWATFLLFFTDWIEPRIQPLCTCRILENFENLSAAKPDLSAALSLPNKKENSWHDGHGEINLFGKIWEHYAKMDL